MVSPQIPDTTLNPAKWMHERIVRSINDFEGKLDDQHEIGARLVQAPGDTIAISDVGYWGPDLVIFYGFNPDGDPVELIQHVSQVNVVLVARKKQSDEPRRIGFDMVKRLSEESDVAE